MTDAHAVAELGADVGSGGGETFERGGLFLLVSMDGDEDAGGFAAGSEDNVGDVAGGDARARLRAWLRSLRRRCWLLGCGGRFWLVARA